MLVVLPYRARRARVRSFWLAGGLVAGAAAGLLAGLLGASPPITLAVFAAAGAAGLACPARAGLAYRAWNKLARAYARVARAAVAAVAYHFVIAAVARLGSRLTVAPSPGSGWVAAAPVAAESYASQSGVAHRVPSRGPWLLRLGGWALRSGNAWSVALLPFLALLHLLEAEEPDQAPADIYTLF